MCTHTGQRHKDWTKCGAGRCMLIEMGHALNLNGLCYSCVLSVAIDFGLHILCSLRGLRGAGKPSGAPTAREDQEPRARTRLAGPHAGPRRCRTGWVVERGRATFSEGVQHMVMRDIRGMLYTYIHTCLSLHGHILPKPRCPKSHTSSTMAAGSCTPREDPAGRATCRPPTMPYAVRRTGWAVDRGRTTFSEGVQHMVMYYVTIRGMLYASPTHTSSAYRDAGS